MSVTVKIEIPDDAFSILRRDPISFAQEMRLSAAVKWYEMGRISQSKAAEFAGLSRSEFLDSLSRFDVSPFQITPDELESEIDHA